MTRDEHEQSANAIRAYSLRIGAEAGTGLSETAQIKASIALVMLQASRAIHRNIDQITD